MAHSSDDMNWVRHLFNLSCFGIDLEEYPDREIAEELITGFKSGFKIKFEGPLQPVSLKNLPSANKAPDILQQKIVKELAAGRKAGHLKLLHLLISECHPLVWFRKKQPGEYRMIRHLSYTEGGSVNDFIDLEICSVQYTKFDDAVKMIKNLGQGTMLGKEDVKGAFRLMIISPDNFQLLGFKFDGNYYFDHCLPFGLSYSCALWEKCATFLHYVVRKSCTRGELEHYLDDILFGGNAATDECKQIMSTFFATCAKMGVPIAEEKIEGPQTVIIFLGFEHKSKKS